MANQLTDCYPEEILTNFPDNSLHQIPEDCLGGSSSDTPGGEGCLSKWQTKKDEAKSSLDIANAKVSNATKKVANAMHWEAKIKIYWENIEKTNELADKVARELKMLKTYVSTFCENAGCMVEALEILYCEVRSIYDPCVNEMVTLIDKINKCLGCITDPAFDRSQGITKAIDAYAAKLQELADLQKEALTKIVKALECANIIYYTICDPEVDKHDFKCDSLQNEIDELLTNFGDCKDCEGSEDGNSCEPLECTSVNKKLEPIPVMPLCKDPYFDKTKGEYESAKTDRETAKNELDTEKEIQQAALMCFNGVTNAIIASKNAKAG